MQKNTLHPAVLAKTIVVKNNTDIISRVLCTCAMMNLSIYDSAFT